MKVFWYRISLALSFWFFMSPFIIKTAGTLQGRGAGILIGLWLIICSYQGMRHAGVWASRGLALGGVACIVWGLVGGKIMHFGGTFHDILVGVLFLLLVWLITRVPQASSCVCTIDGDAYIIDQMSVENHELVCYIKKDNQGDAVQPHRVALPFASMVATGGLLHANQSTQLVKGLIRAANELHKHGE